MKINMKNEEKVRNTLDEVQKKTHVRKLSLGDLRVAVKEAQEKLDQLGIPKKHRNGCYVIVEPEKVPNNYGYEAEGTGAIIVRYPSGWFLADLQRERCRKEAYGGIGPTFQLKLSPEAWQNIPTNWKL